jgi:Spy/CpxP family protein refolding chaperone
MSNIKTLAIAAALLVGASSLAMAQSTQNSAPGSTQNNAAASGGPGTHVGAMRSGSAESNQKVLKNQNGYAPGHQ